MQHRDVISLKVEGIGTGMSLDWKLRAHMYLGSQQSGIIPVVFLDWTRKLEEGPFELRPDHDGLSRHEKGEHYSNSQAQETRGSMN